MKKTKKLSSEKVVALVNEAYDKIELASLEAIEELLAESKTRTAYFWNTTLKPLYIEEFKLTAFRIRNEMIAVKNNTKVTSIVTPRNTEHLINEAYDMVELISIQAMEKFFYKQRYMFSKKKWLEFFKPIYLDKFGEKTVPIVEDIRKRVRK